jgi:hypothetical protein
MTPLLDASGAYDRAAIMRKAWRDFRHVRALGDVEMTFADWLRNAWRVAKGQRASYVVVTIGPAGLPDQLTIKTMAPPTIAKEAPRPWR